uniref:Uncharacterized protein n=1 Tax=Gopherus agassizii TaxID=38772 RepID=A0A452J2C5_9SAUR
MPLCSPLQWTISTNLAGSLINYSNLRTSLGDSLNTLHFVYLPCLQVRPIMASTGRGSLSQANGGFRKWHRPRDVLAAASRRPHWPGTANRSQWDRVSCARSF